MQGFAMNGNVVMPIAQRLPWQYVMMLPCRMHHFPFVGGNVAMVRAILLTAGILLAQAALGNLCVPGTGTASVEAFLSHVHPTTCTMMASSMLGLFIGCIGLENYAFLISFH